MLLGLTPIEEEKPDKASGFKACFSLLGKPFILLSFIGIMCHVGIDVGTNTTAPKILMERLDMTLAEAGLQQVFILFPYGGLLPRSLYLAKGFCKVFLCSQYRVHVAGNGGIIYIPFGNNYLYLHCHDWFR